MPQVFSQPPALPYFWDESCKLDNKAPVATANAEDFHDTGPLTSLGDISSPFVVEQLCCHATGSGRR